MSIKIKVTGLDKVLAELDVEKIKKQQKIALTSFGLRVVATAQQKAPVDEGRLRAAIYSEVKPDGVHVGCTVDYAAYIEFGTRKFAAAYVATLPPTWQQFAATFKGPAGGTFDQFLNDLVEWVRRKGIATAAKSRSVAYAIAINILREGIKPQPFMYPAVKEHLPRLLQELEGKK